MKDNEEGFLRQTANDYDMDYEDVKYIREKYPERFYEALEDFIKNRAELS